MNLWYGLPGDGILRKTAVVDYQQLELRNNVAVSIPTGQGVSEHLAAVNYNPSGGTNSVVDLVIDIDLRAATDAEFPVLRIDKAGLDPANETFNPQPIPSGTGDEYFRFSLAGTRILWRDSMTFLAKYFWGQSGPNAFATGYRDPFSEGWVLNALKHGVGVSETESIAVGVDIKRPDEFKEALVLEPTGPQPNASGSVTLNPTAPGPGGPGAPSACLGVDGITTWQHTDQYFRATGCSAYGHNIRYRWDFGTGNFTPFTQDTLVDFRGHSTPGNYTVTLEVRDISTNLSSVAQQTINVQPGATTISGDTYIQDKVARYYRANVWRGYWFERYDTLSRWYGTTEGEPDSVYRRIWPRGDYAVEVRQENSLLGVLARGLIRVEMCYNTCSVPPIELAAHADAPPISNKWSILGGGPVISYESGHQPTAIQYYNLTGNHAANSPFESTTGLLEIAGTVTAGGGQITWTQEPSTSDQIHHTRFAVTPPVAGTVFGMAVDFDLGADPTDDSAGFDRKRGLVYVTDNNKAVGVLMLVENADAINSLVQFGAKRIATGAQSDVWKAQRRTGSDLLPGADDVQLLISATQISHQTTYDLFIFEARNLALLRRLADRVRNNL